MQKEIDLHLELTDSRRVLLDYHSVLNLFNVLHHEIDQLIAQVNVFYLPEFKELMINVLMSLLDSELESNLKDLEEGLEKLTLVLRDFGKENPGYADNVEAILTIVEIAFMRVNEFKEDRFVWQEIPIKDFEKLLFSFLAATERVSRSRFHFKYPPAKPTKDDFLIIMDVVTDQEHLFAPPVLNDIIRDLTANSRKYSQPGSTITIHLSQIENHGIRLTISDEGMGIPEDEIQNVIQFKHRASNAKHLKTMGKGFGLTKAYHLCKAHKGTFLMDSEVGKGTTITLSMFPVEESVWNRNKAVNSF